MDHKTFSAYNIKSDASQGIVESIVAVMGNADQGDDVIHNGAFVKSIQERRGKIRVLDQHQTDSIMRAIGKPLEMREIPRDQLPADLLARYPNATGGLYTKTQYLMDTPEGRGAFQRIAAGAVDEYSIGYDPLDVTYSKMKMPDGSEKTVRDLRTIKLYEYSPVLFGMNDATQTLSAKGATGASDLPLADRARAWDSANAEGRVRSWAGATDAPNAKYRSAFFWYDSDAPDNFTSYKLQFADVIDGKLTAIPRGIFAVAAVLQGSRGGTNIPQADQDAVKSKVNGYYARMRKEFDDDSIVAPWENKSLQEEWNDINRELLDNLMAHKKLTMQIVKRLSYKDTKPWNVFHEGGKWNVYKIDADGNAMGDRLGSFDTETEARAQVRALYASESNKSVKSTDLTSYVQEVTEAFNEQYGMDAMMQMGSMGECFCIWRVFDDHVIVCEMMSDDYYQVDYSMVNGEIVFAPKPLWIEGDLQFAPETAAGGTGEMKRYTPPLRPINATKAGRVLAQRNADRIMSAMQSLMAALSDAGIEMGGMSSDTTDNTDNAPAGKRAAGHDAQAQAGPSTMTPTDETLKASIEIELAELKLLEV